MEIRLSELRLGNYIDIQNTVRGWQCAKVTSISNLGIEVDCTLTTQPMRYQGIHLTLEILAKCGFCFDDNIWYWQTIDLQFDDDIQEFVYYAIKAKPIRLSYLHQLQNLIFALTGEELKVNL